MNHPEAREIAATSLSAPLRALAVAYVKAFEAGEAVPLPQELGAQLIETIRRTASLRVVK